MEKKLHDSLLNRRVFVSFQEFVGSGRSPWVTAAAPDKKSKLQSWWKVLRSRIHWGEESGIIRLYGHWTDIVRSLLMYQFFNADAGKSGSRIFWFGREISVEKIRFQVS